MTNLERLTKLVQERKEKIFSLANYWEDTLNRFQDINFLGEIDKNILYVTMLHQVVNCEDGSLRDLTFDESDEFYYSGENRLLNNNYMPFAWTFWRINLDMKFITVFTSFNNSYKISPKENFGMHYENRMTYEKQQLMYEAKINKLVPEQREIFEKLIELVQFSKNHIVEEHGYNRKVFHNISNYYGLMKKGPMVDGQWLESQAPEIIKIPQRHTPLNIRAFGGATRILRGLNFNQIDFEHDAHIQKFTNIKDLHDFFYSLITHINRNSLLFTVERINEVKKIWNSYQWEYPSTEKFMEYNPNIPEFEKLVKEEIREMMLDPNEMVEIRIDKIDGTSDYQMKPKLEILYEEYVSNWGKLSSEERKQKNEDLNIRRLKDAFKKYEVAITKHDNRIYLRATIHEHGVCYYLTNA